MIHLKNILIHHTSMSYLSITFFTLVAISSCSKPRPFLCACYSDTSRKNYDIDVKAIKEAEEGCGIIQSRYGWDSCQIVMHE